MSLFVLSHIIFVLLPFFLSLALKNEIEDLKEIIEEELGEDNEIDEIVLLFYNAMV